MCQIIVSQSFNLSFELVASIFKSNSDGLGFIGGGEPVKTLPKNLKEAWRFYKAHIHGRSGAMHARWRTDGEISLERVHPYTVLEGRLWVMHNGVLSDFRSSGKDPESDTEKYVNQILKPLLKRAPTLWKQKEFQWMLSKQIGSTNRLVFVDNHGEIAIINRGTGYEVGKDWYANGYSFDCHEFFPEVFGPPFKTPSFPMTSYPSTNVSAGYSSGQPYKGSSYNGRSYSTPSEIRKDTSHKARVLMSNDEWAEQLAQQELREYFDEINGIRRIAGPQTRQEVEVAWNLDLDSAEGLALALGYKENDPAKDVVATALDELRQVSPHDYFQFQHEIYKLYRDCRNDEDLENGLYDVDAALMDLFDSFGIVADFDAAEGYPSAEDDDGPTTDPAASIPAGEVEEMSEYSADDDFAIATLRLEH